MNFHSDNVLIISSIVLLISALVWTSGCLEGENDNDLERIEGGPWKDLKDLKKMISGVTVFSYNEVGGPSDLDDITNPENSIYMLIGIEKNITSSDYNSIKGFIQRGGMVIVADDGTRANRLTALPKLSEMEGPEFVGKNYLVDNTLLEEEAGYDPGYEFNISFIRSVGVSRGQIFDLIIHEPKGILNPDDGNVVLSTTKELTVIDMNSNGEMDAIDHDTHESQDKFSEDGAIAVEYGIGDNGGGILYVSTSGLFTDNVFARWDNDDWLKNYLYSIIPQGGDVMLDSSKQAYNYSPHLVKIPS